MENLKGTITNRLPQYTEDEPEYGTLSIKKVLRAESGAEITDADLDRSFIFTISLKDENGEALSGTSLYGGLVFTDGKANVRIPANVTMTLDYIPVGYLYTVTEEDTQQFMESGWNTNGTIETNLTSRVIYTNTKSAVEEQFNSFTVRKAVTGIYEIDADYHFTASLMGLHAEEEYTLSDGSKFTSDTNGSAVIDFSLKNNEEITISDMPVGASYKVTEAAGDYISSYFITDSQDTGNIVRVTDANTQTGRSLSTATEYIENNEEITITFTNSKDARQDVVLRKILANASETNADVFTFTAQISGLAPNETIRTGLGVRSADENGDLSMVFEKRVQIEGIVTENYGAPVPYAELAFGKEVIQCDENGRFHLMVAPDADIHVEAHHWLYGSMERVIDSQEFTHEIELRLEDKAPVECVSLLEEKGISTHMDGSSLRIDIIRQDSEWRGKGLQRGDYVESCGRALVIVRDDKRLIFQFK